MSKFLNDYASRANKLPSIALEEKAALFEEAIEAIDGAVNGRAFRPVRSLNAAVFDAVMVGVANRLADGSKPKSSEIATAYDRLMKDEAFKKGWIRATADEENVRSRMKAAVKAFEDV